MKFKIVHEIRGRIRVHMVQNKMSFKEADILQYYLERQKNITAARVYERTQDVAITFTGSRTEVLRLLKEFSYVIRLPDG